MNRSDTAHALPILYNHARRSQALPEMPSPERRSPIKRTDSDVFFWYMKRERKVMMKRGWWEGHVGSEGEIACSLGSAPVHLPWNTVGTSQDMGKKYSDVLPWRVTTIVNPRHGLATAARQQQVPGKEGRCDAVYQWVDERSQ